MMAVENLKSTRNKYGDSLRYRYPGSVAAADDRATFWIYRGDPNCRYIGLKNFLSPL